MTEQYSLEFSLQAGNDKGPIIATTAAEVDAAIDRLAAADPLLQTPTVFVRERPRFGPAKLPDHGLKIALDSARAVGALAYYGPGDELEDEGPWVTLGALSTADGAELYQDLDSGSEFPADAAVPLDLVRSAIHAFRMNGGQRPDVLAWRTSETW
ncbi:Imm1 family immunity protein [Amycolatopsis sp. NPDC059657]|uniref:Imm1 family immunity protein n=1 Tax=Amycolatopsis sp. NPDC059657 TaxID=3346899 RepID=UPI00366FB4B2